MQVAVWGEPPEVFVSNKGSCSSITSAPDASLGPAEFGEPVSEHEPVVEMDPFRRRIRQIDDLFDAALDLAPNERATSATRALVTLGDSRDGQSPRVIV